jgi:SAM-dependent methyltransferase
MRYNAAECWGLTQAQLAEFYLLEKSLAKRLRESPRTERLKLYGEVYNELFDRLPYHPMVVRKKSESQRALDVGMQVRFLRRFLRADTDVLEIGAGDCAVAVELASMARKVYALDVSEVISGGQVMPGNVERMLSDGTSIPLPPDSVDVAYSNQLMEHLHPDDAREQLSNIARVLKRGGRYVCVTPSRLAGPHDVSRFFDDAATGFHLREYTYSELGSLFLAVGFRRVEAYLGQGRTGLYVRLPLAVIRLLEQRAAFVTRLSCYEERQRFMNRLPYLSLRSVRIVGVK